MKQLPRPEYPLTPEAKELAKKIVQAWDNGDIPQRESFGDDTLGFFKISNLSNDKNTYSHLMELNHYGLIEFNRTISDKRISRLEILLLQELRNAVANDFKVSDYFLTMNVQGNIFIENSRIQGDINNNAFNSGVIQQNVTQIARDLRDMLGQELLKENPDLVTSIDEFQLSTDQNRQNKYGKVVLELGRCLQHGANATVVIQAISWFANLFL